MMDWLQLHLHWFAHGQDPVVWLRVARVILFAAAAIVMWKEPMLCGGKNTFLHRLIAIFLGTAAIYNWGIARARMVVLTQNPQALATIDLLLFDLVYTVMAMVLLGKLLYDYYRWRAYEKVKAQPHECGPCPDIFEP